jgi:hypothetical protein
MAIRAGVTGAPVDGVEGGIVTAGDPGGGGAVLIAIAEPGFDTFLAGAGNGPEAPGLFAGFDVEGGEIAAGAELAAGAADDDLILNDQGGDGARVPLAIGGDGDVPEDVAGGGVEGD